MSVLKSLNTEKWIDKLSQWAGVFSSQRHLSAIRESFVYLMPLIIVASIFILVNNVILNESSGLVGLLGLGGSWVASAQEIGIRVYNGTLNLLGLFATIMIAYRLASSYGEEGSTYSVFAVACLVLFFPLEVPVTLADGTVQYVGGFLSYAETSATGLFVGMFVAIISTEALRFVSKNEKLKISMPDSVPPAVARSFNSLIPMLLVLTFFSMIAFSLSHFFDLTIHELVNVAIQTPLQSALQGLGGVITLLFFQNLLWFFGIHSASIMLPITEPTLLVAIQENAAALTAGVELPHIVTKPFLDAFGFMGGGGQTIGLIIALWIAAKREDNRIITKLSTAPALFNINEPLIFGLPIIFNPILVIPFLLTPIASVTIAYIATATGIIAKTSVLIPWTTPPVLSAFLATSGDWKAAVLALLLLCMSVLIYLPFIFALNRQKVEG